MLIFLIFKIATCFDLKILFKALDLSRIKYSTDCFIRNYETLSAFNILSEQKIENYEHVSKFIELLAETLELNLENISECINKESRYLVADVIRGLETEPECVGFYGLEEFLTQKNYLKYEEFYKKKQKNKEFFVKLENNGENIFFDALCSYRSKKIGALLFSSTSLVFSTQIPEFFLVLADHHFQSFSLNKNTDESETNENYENSNSDDKTTDYKKNVNNDEFFQQDKSLYEEENLSNEKGPNIDWQIIQKNEVLGF